MTKLRYYKDDSIYFYILGMTYGDDLVPIKSIPEGQNVFNTLKECMTYIHFHKRIKDEIKKSAGYPNQLIIVMNQYNPARAEKLPGHILYYCEAAIFKFDNSLNLKEVVFDFRKTIDDRLSFGIYDMQTKVFTYGDHDVNIMKFLEEECLDRELADFLMHDDLSFIY